MKSNTERMLDLIVILICIALAVCLYFNIEIFIELLKVSSERSNL